MSAKSLNVRSAGVASVSQAFSAASNFLIVLALGRYGGARSVGEFSVALAIYAAFLGLQRAALCSPLMARAEGATSPVEDERRYAVTLSLAMAVPISLALAGTGAMTSFHPLCLLGIVLPGVLAQDAFRYLFFRNLRPTGAVLLDGLWVLGSGVSFVLLRHDPSSDLAILLWGGSGVIGAVVGATVLDVRAAPLRDSFRWWRSSLWRSSRWLTLEAALYNLDLQIQAFGFTLLAGAAAFGTLQVAGSLVGVAFFVTTGATTVLLTHFAGERRPGPKDALRVSVINFLAIAMVTAVLLGTSTQVVHLLYGNRIAVPRLLILAVGINNALLGASGGAYAYLLAKRREQEIPLARLALLVFAPIAVVVSHSDFQLAMWILDGSAAAQLVILSWAAHRCSRGSGEDNAAVKVDVHDGVQLDEGGQDRRVTVGRL